MLSNRKMWRLRVGVVCREDRRHHIEDFDERHRRFLCRLAVAPVRRPPPPQARVAGP